MAEIHDLIIHHGAERAREMVPAEQRRYVDIAAALMEEERLAIGITYAGFCLTSLPHKPRPADEVWTRPGARVTLMISPGHVRDQGKTVPIGVPYGARARMILFYLQSEALKRSTREVVLGRSMNEWFGRMGVSVGGTSFAAIRDQARRISRCILTFDWNDSADHVQFGIVDGAFNLGGEAADGRQGKLFEEVVHLSEGFYSALRDHPVPVRDTALKELCSQSMALDAYVWLAYRLHSLSKPMPISWPALYQQFGGGFAQMKHFKPRFVESLRAALAAYPEARVDLDTNGLVLIPSPPPVPKLTAA
ncbi:replication protein RepA (plasmid) [Azospirillum sp. HJ39]|uniref:replication protein RepA n=1 Tax=Azospirillum sp. HJ39 TaxID=3159496 RepID=UPI003559094A